MDYQAVGSGEGIQRFIAGAVDFGASDVPMNSKELSAAHNTGGAVEQIPIALGGLAVGYHLDGVTARLRLSGQVLADIYLGRITTWNAPEITALNPGVKLPAFGITVLHRLDSSGTTYIFTDYLSRVSPAWKTRVGAGKIALWPTGPGGTGNDGVAGLLQQIPGSIAYFELAYLSKYHATDVLLENAAHHFVAPNKQSVAAAAAAIPHISATHFSIVNAPGAQSYPICGYSWVLVRQHGARSRELADLFRWMASTGQNYAGQLGYVPLPAVIQAIAARAVSRLH